MAVSKANQKAAAKYVKTHYDRIEIRAPKGFKEEIQAHANEQGESVNAFVKRSVDNQIERDKNGGNPEC